MAKIMLVEDDTNLSEIYQARLTAEGYDIVSAHDGEEALALAAKEKPDLVISDVMMPKISGFEMLDILRNTEGLKETKVIMLTALGQADDKSRAESMGADRYLVKSQVTLEDIVKAAEELLGGDTSAPAPAEPVAAATPAPTPAAPTPTPVAVAVAAPPEPQQPVAAVPVAAPPQPQAQAVAPMPTTPAPSMPTTPATAPPVAVPVATTPDPTPVPTVIPTPAPVAAMAPVAPAPQPQAQAVAPAPTTPAPVPAAPVDATSAADNQLVTSAVEDLEKAAQPSPAPAPAATTDSPAKDVGTTAPPASPSPETDDTTSSNGGVAHKKVIKPIDSSDSPKPNLETLLANEERKNPGSTMDDPIAAGRPQGQPTTTPAPRVPHQPGHIISPDAAATGPDTGGGVDPNSIAL